jgi:hypothetical protein
VVNDHPPLHHHHGIDSCQCPLSAMNLSKLKKHLRAVRADWILDISTEIVISIHYRSVMPDWITFGEQQGYLSIEKEENKYIPIKLTQKGFDWMDTWKEQYCISGRRIK